MDHFSRVWIFLLLVSLAVEASAWSSCSRSCGGGSQSEETCWWITGWFCETNSRSCNNICLNGGTYAGRCHCPEWVDGYCCENCKAIKHCHSGHQSCTNTGATCDSCERLYYPGGLNKGCLYCPPIDNCEAVHCTVLEHNMCANCVDNNVFFKKTHADTACERLCAWNGHTCWPGVCGDELTRNCQCTPGFYRETTPTETTCQLESSNKPSIETCDFIVVGPSGEKKRASQTGTSSACQSKGDVFGNFQPKVVEYDYLSFFAVDATAFPPKPDFIVESKFGVTDASIISQKRGMDGSTLSVSPRVVISHYDAGQAAKEKASKGDNITISPVLKDGDRFCLTYEAKGGGYLIATTTTSPRTRQPAVPYSETVQSKELCYKFDNSPPKHCLESAACTNEPIQLDQRVVRTPIVTMNFDGWFDPIPGGADASMASGIELYDISVNEVPGVQGSNAPLKVSLKMITNATVPSSVKSVTLNLTSERPILYCITLTVKDIADNVQSARQFVLYDNTSYITSRPANTFHVTSASVETHFTWQTHHYDVCLNWRGYFFNKVYFDNPVLAPIAAEPNGFIKRNSVYEQTNGLLPVSGTPNVDGIIEYNLYWSLNGGTVSKSVPVPNFQDQSICKSFALQDGQTYLFRIQAIDIANNTYSENRTVHIDRSVPQINRVWLTKDGYKRLYVHDSKDLAQMTLEFEAMDPHSGIREVHWTFGAGDGVGELGNGALSVDTVGQACANTTIGCYCPDVGQCEMYSYSISLNSLEAANKHRGDHNRNYNFRITVTNHARLSNTKHVDILVDDSPPEPGVVNEGPVDSPDIDYTSDLTFIINWHGFIDHESDIKMYRVGLADRCLAQHELYLKGNATNNGSILTREVVSTERTLLLPANFTGKRYVTVIAINNAMDPSIAVCSDGITRDISAPEIRNVTIQHGRWSESIGCLNDKAWLLTTELQKVVLDNVSSCQNICQGVVDSTTELLSTLAHQDEDQEISDFMCNTMPLYTNQKHIYIPNDHINIQWDIEKGLSQIQGLYVGFGTDPSETTSPGLVDYVSTGKNIFFRRQHEGIGTHRLFYIFIKAVSKAGLEKVVIVGPVLIDETPPLARHVANVTLTQTDVVVGWENNTFYDLEQTEQINHILMQIDHGTEHASPVLEWRLDQSTACPGFTGGCLTFLIRHLQRQDTDLGLEFHAVLTVYNNAGHYTRVTGPTFRVPSRYPPGHALILDIDPADPDTSRDTNVHFTPHTTCATWTGFKYHENISIEVGIGTSMGDDNTVTFRKINTTNSHCVINSDIESGGKYFFNIRASCTGGHTLSHSNGVMIYSENNIRQYLAVKSGTTYKRQSVFVTTMTNHTNSSITFTFPGHLIVGRSYRVAITTETGIIDDIQLKSIDVIVSNISHDTNTSRTFTIRPFLRIPKFSITNNAVNGSIEYQAEIGISPKAVAYQSSTSNLCSHWSCNDIDTSILKFEATTVISHCAEDNSTCTELMSPFLMTDTDSSTTITGLKLRPGVVYKTAIRPCTITRCLDYVLSDSVMIDNLPPSGDIARAEMEQGDTHTNCHTVRITWHAFASLSGIVIYQWSIAADKDGISTLTHWWNILPTEENMEFQVSECIVLPVHPYRTLFACVRAYSEVGYDHTACKLLTIPVVNIYNRHTVYDFDTTSQNWKVIQQILHSALLGEKLSLLHQSELDFGNTDTAIAGAIIYANERQVTWYLMKSAYIPALCNTDENCITTATSSTGFVKFRKSPHNHVYFICAYSNVTYVERELFTEYQGEIRYCSNGFVIDTISPVGGFVEVTNTRRYIVDNAALEVTWGGFSDNLDATIMGYGTALYQYSVYIGSAPGRDDLIYSKTFDGTSSTMLLRDFSLPDGTTVFVTVTAFDYAGNNISVTSQELIVDTTPPTEGSVRPQSDLGTGHYFGSDTVRLYLAGFQDPESGIRHFQIGIGSQEDTMDTIPATAYTTDHVELRTDIAQLHDGHRYFINVVATNRADLSSNTVSTSFILDRSAPIGGHVIDGRRGRKDVDYQADTSHIHGSWRGFSDPHSEILYYRVALGSKPFTNDIHSSVDVGLSTEISWNSTFIPGLRYFITVEACNWAELCTTRSSDGIVLDNSPPIPGQVNVASGINHWKYVPHSTSAHVEWVGFEDPQSGLDHFDFCLGTSPLYCDIQPWSNCLLSSSTIKTGLHLPTNTDIYANVMATNKAGLRVTQSSDSFRVDNSPPISVRRPTFISDFNVVSGFPAQWEKSVLRIQWEFEDRESPIVRHIITLLTHHEGHTPIEHIELGAENKLTINLDSKQWLHNGDSYIISVTACNAAGLCATNVSDDLLIDATPPHLGGLKPSMTWYNWKRDSGTTASTVELSWYGFHDQESGIHRYYITIGRTYSGQELSNGTLVVFANDTTFANTGIFNLTEAISPDDEVIVSIWAENNAGLKSSTARVTVEALATTTSRDKGIFEIQKHSCDVYYCNKDCTCAVVGKPCVDARVNGTCSELNASDVSTLGFPSIDVYVGVANEHQIVTASSACLTGHWHVNNLTKTNVHRYEWSMGIAGQPIGYELFDIKQENPWKDVGLRTDAIHCLPLGRSLTHTTRYIVYVRAWYGRDQYAVFRSEPIVGDQTAPSVRRGGFVKDSDSSCHVDYDYIDWVDSITGCWESVFRESHSAILYYTVALGTSANSDDVHRLTNVGLQTSYTVTNLSLSHGTRYYFTVTAYNTVGLHMSVSSDGFVVDTDDPLPGIVFTTARHRDVAVQSSNTSLSLSWHGFVDHYSGIRSYHAAVVKAGDINKWHYNYTFRNVGLQNTIGFININLEHSGIYHGVVYAVDAAGHMSNMSLSRGVLIDTTAPVGFTCHNFNTVLEYTNQESTNDSHWVIMSHSFVQNRLYKVSGEIQSIDPEVNVRFELNRLSLMLPTAVNHDGTVVFEYNLLSSVTGRQDMKLDIMSSINATVATVLQECTAVDFDSSRAVEVQQISDSRIAVNIQVLDKESSLYKVLVGAGTTPGGFQVRTLSPVRGGNNGVISTDVPHGSQVYVTVIAENYAGLRSTFHGGPITMDHTPPEIEELMTHLDTSPSSLTSEISIVAEWKAIDTESGIKRCWCNLVGLTATEAKNSTTNSNSTSCVISLPDVHNGQRLSVSVNCVNAVQLITSVTSRTAVISSRKPSSENARVEFVPADLSSLSTMTLIDDPQITPIQSNDTCVHLAWAGFSDPSGIHHYEYRLLKDNHTTVDWTSTDMRTQILVSKLNIADGSMITGDVRAVNGGGYQSDTIATGLIVYGREPQLSGVPMKTVVHGNRVRLDWHDVFTLNSNVPATYSLLVGSQLGYSDLTDVPFASTDTYEVVLPEFSILTQELNEVHVIITCTYSTGMHATYRSRISI